MVTVKDALIELDFGSSVAEFDKQLESYFVETQPFYDLINDKRDIIAGDKGTGKTAIFRVLHQRYYHLDQLKKTIVVPAFNPQGNPIFQALAEKGVLEEGEYIRFWKAYFLSVVGNWILNTNKYRPRSKLALLDTLLKGLDFRSEAINPKPILERVLNRIGQLFKWRSIGVDVKIKDDSFTFTPKVELAGEDATDKSISIEAALRLLNECLAEIDKRVWVALDRLDEAFQGAPETEIPALRALFRTYLDLEEFDRVKLKLFVRRDLFSRIVKGGFVNLTHINARKIELKWDEDDLRTLLCRRVRQNEIFCDKAGLRSASDKQVFGRLFPEQVDQGSRKPVTWVWLMSRISDGNDLKPPRNLIDLVSFAREIQLRKEDRTPRLLDSAPQLIESESLRAALVQLSETRVNDTLLAEAKSEIPLIEKFRKGKAEHNEESLAKVLGIKLEQVRDRIRPLMQLGFLAEVGSNFKIPILYRAGLEITQGKAAGVSGANGEDE